VSSTETRARKRFVIIRTLARDCCIAALLAVAPASAQQQRPGLAHVSAYADLADLALAAPVVVSAKVHAFVRVPKKEAPGLPEGARRYLVRADVDAALIAPGALPSRIQYLWDVPSNVRPDIDDKPVLLFLAPVKGRADQFRLVSPRAQVAATPALDTQVRAILKQARDPALGHRVTGVTRAFTTPGSVPGEEQTQIFLKTADAAPVSLIVTTRPGEAKRYGVAFSETIDPDAPPATKGTLGAYYLACGLPPHLPAEAIADLDDEAKATVAADYAFVLTQLAACGRTGTDASSKPTEAQSG